MQLEFDIPDDSNGDKNITRKDVVMYLFQNGTWIALPTCATGIKNGRVLYRSESPEFSLFAITINNTPFSQSQDPAFAKSPESDTIPKEHNGESGVPIVPDSVCTDHISRQIRRTTRSSCFFRNHGNQYNRDKRCSHSTLVDAAPEPAIIA